MDADIEYELLWRLRRHVEIAVTGKKYEDSWMKPIFVSFVERDAHGFEALAIIDHLLKKKENDSWELAHHALTGE